MLYKRRAIMNNNSKKYWKLLILALVIVFAGSLLAWGIDTLWGKVDVKLVDFVGDNGTLLHGRLYIPDGVTSEKPAPAVLFIHGGDASSDKYSMYSVEFARRGYVVFNFDQRGHAFSEGLPLQLQEYGYGGPEALRFLHGLDIVDANNIALAGHSMGGSAVGAAAFKYPEYYQSIMFIGSTSPVLEGYDPSTLRNVAYNCGMDDGCRYRESTMGDLASMFGVDDIASVEGGKMYGSIEDGTAKLINYVKTVHNAEYIYPPSIAYTIDWVQKTVSPPKSIAPTSQIWIWRYVGSTIALAGAIFLMLPLGSLLLHTSFFKSLAEAVPEFKGPQRRNWWIVAVITAVIAPATLFYFHGLTAKSVGKLWEYNRITGIMGWAVLVAVVTAVLLLIYHFVLKGDQGATAYNYGLTWKERLIDWGRIGKSVLLAICIIIPLYILVAAIYHWLNVDFRMWNEGLRLLTLHRVGDVLKYVVPFALAFVVFGANLHGMLRAKGGSASLGREMLTNILIMSPWYYLWAIWRGPLPYISNHPAGPSFASGFMTHWFWALPPIMLAFTVISTYFYRKTGKVYVGAFVNAIFVCWVILAEQMTAGFVIP
jgi:poly(3-hydroxybutyrate) depolymerase